MSIQDEVGTEPGAGHLDQTSCASPAAIHRRLHQILYGCPFTATQPRCMEPLRGVPDTNFKFFNFRFGLAGPAVDAMLREFLQWAGSHPAVRKPTEHLKVLQSVFYAVAQARAEHLYHGKRCVVGFLSHPKSFTKKHGAVEMPGHSVFTRTLQFLVERGYITVEISPGNLRCSYFEATDLFPPFSDALAYVVLSRKGIVELRTARRSEAYLPTKPFWDSVTGRYVRKRQYRRVGRELVDPKDYTPEQALHLQLIEARLTVINERVFEHTYHVVENGEFRQVYSGQAMYHIVYNNQSITAGGRMYCGLQNLPQRNHSNVPDFEPLRSTLHIDGKPTVEADFCNHHMAMMYNGKGLACPKNCYAIPIPGWDVPDDDPLKVALTKVVSLALPNCGSTLRTNPQKFSSITSMTAKQFHVFNKKARAKRAREIPKPPERRRLAGEFEEDGNLGGPTYEDALNAWNAYEIPAAVTPDVVVLAILSFHGAISDQLCTGVGTRLQCLDGGIALNVVERFIQLGKPIVCIHDSFRVWVDDIELLERVMCEEYERVFPGFPPKLKRDMPPAGMPQFPVK